MEEFFDIAYDPRGLAAWTLMTTIGSLTSSVCYELVLVTFYSLPTFIVLCEIGTPLTVTWVERKSQSQNEERHYCYSKT